MKVRYAPLRGGLDFKKAYQFETEWDLDDLEFVIEECADDFHHNHDGWEHHWPLEFKLWDHTGKELGDFLVEREMTPVFAAYKKE